MVAGKASRLAKSGTYAGKIPKGAESGDKLTRFSSQRRAGNLKILRGLWNEDLFRVLEGFPDLAHDDEVDACSGALEMLNPDMESYGAFEAARQRAEQLLAEQQRDKPQPTQPTWAPGSMEWLARAEQIELNRSSCAEMYARVLGPLRGHGAKTEFTLTGRTEGSNPLSSSGESLDLTSAAAPRQPEPLNSRGSFERTYF